MSTESLRLTTFYQGWDGYQRLLAGALAPLSQEQLDLRAAPNLRSIRELALHIIAVRARWFNGLMGEGGAEIAAIGSWDRPGQPARTAADLVQGLEATWQLVAECLARWTPTDLAHVFSGTHNDEEYRFTRQWVIWHVIEHDLHHGGELGFSLGLHGLAAPDL